MGNKESKAKAKQEEVARARAEKAAKAQRNQRAAAAKPKQVRALSKQGSAGLGQFETPKGEVKQPAAAKKIVHRGSSITSALSIHSQISQASLKKSSFGRNATIRSIGSDRTINRSKSNILDVLSPFGGASYVEGEVVEDFWSC